MNDIVLPEALKIVALACAIFAISAASELSSKCSFASQPQESGRDYFAEFALNRKPKWSERDEKSTSYSFRCDVERRFKGTSVSDESIQIEAKRLGEQQLIKLLNRHEPNASRVLGFNSDYCFELGRVGSNEWYPKIVNDRDDDSELEKKFSQLVIHPDNPHIILGPDNLSLGDIPWEDTAKVKLVNVKSLEFSNNRSAIEFEFSFSFDSSVKNLSGRSAEAYKKAVIRFDPEEWLPVYSEVEYDSGSQKIRCVSNIEYSNEGVISGRTDHHKFLETQSETSIAMSGFEWQERPKSDEFRMPYFGLPEFSTSKMNKKLIFFAIVGGLTAIFVVAKKTGMF